jgi:alkaline phosphatase
MVRDMMNGADPASVLASAAGIDSLRSDEQAMLADADGDRRALYGAVSEIIGRRSLVGWTSLAHTAVDVSTYAYGPGWQAFIGSHENTYIGETLARMMDTNLTDLTQQLRRPEPASSSR